MSDVIQPIAHPINRAVVVSGISRSGLYERIKSGELSIIKIGRRTLILDEDLRALVNCYRIPGKKSKGLLNDK